MARLALALVVLAACGDNLPRPPRAACDAWTQWGGNPAHDGSTCNVGQPLARELANIVFDPFTPDEELDSGEDLLVHYQVPLLADGAVYMMMKAGTYTPCDRSMTPADCFTNRHRLESQIWTEVRYDWRDGVLTPTWTFASDWKPVQFGFFEQVFQPALAGDAVAIPGAGGSVWLVDAATGEVRSHVAPLGDDPDTYVAGPIAVDYDNIFYNAVHLDRDDPYNMPEQSWLVGIAPDGSFRTADYANLVPDAPAADDLCRGRYDQMVDVLPYPELDGDGAVIPPKDYYCGSQQPGLNSAPAFAYDGTMYVVTHAQYIHRYSYIVAVSPSSLAAIWATSLRDRVTDGCGVNLPYMDVMGTGVCRPGAPMGIDPSTAQLPALEVDDDSSSSPIALPDGGVLYGAVSLYNDFRGHLVKLDRDGDFVASYDFGWDTTPAIIGSGLDFQIAIKDNHYSADDAGPYFITELDASLGAVWRFQDTETQSCERQPDGTVTCTNDHPGGFEWCVNAPVADQAGVIYANSEDGHVYAINPDGTVRDRFFLDKSLGAAYTPLSIDGDGRIYALNNGRMAVIGGP